MFTIQQEIGELMIELIPVQPDYPGIAALVIAMACFTGQRACILVLSMESLLFTYILGNQFVIVTGKA